MRNLNIESEYEVKFQRINPYYYFKRGFDIIFALFLFTITLPISALACLAVFMQDFKNPIFVQKRVGLMNREFNMFKIRSMVVNAEKDGAQWADKDDNRITAIGRFIRRTRIDELPQLVNVLIGDMSMIGPRPEREIFYREFEKTIPNFRDRLAVRPGITGYAQVNGGYDIDPEKKLELDLYYIDNLGFKIELNIFFKTIGVVFTGDGAR